MTPANNPRANRAPPPIAENLKQALHLAGRGLRVFPLIENGATPAFSSWQDRATSDPSALSEWFEGPYRNCNVGVATGQGVFVVDADIKNGGRGLSSLEQMEMEGLDLGFTVDTRSGGRHAYFLIPDDAEIPCSVRAFEEFPDIDIRARGGYVVAPGTTIDGKTYTVRDAAPIPPSPLWLAERARAAKRIRDKASADPLIELDTEPSIQRAIMYLRDDAPSAQEGAGGNDMTYMVAARVKDFGVSEPMCFELMDHHWNEAKAFPSWDPAGLEKIIGNAYSYGTSSPGVKSALAEFDAVEIEAPANDNRGKPLTASRVDLSDLLNLPPRQWLYGFKIQRKYVSFLVSPGGVGKTAWEIAAALAMASHSDLLGDLSRKPLKVWVYNLEDDMVEMRRRLSAALCFYKLPPETLENIRLNSGRDRGFKIVKTGQDGSYVTLPDFKLLIEEIKREAIDVLFVDPFLRSHSVSENENEAQDEVMRLYAQIADETSCAIVLVHHTKKGAIPGEMDSMRGASTQGGGARAVISLAPMTVEEAAKLSVPERLRRLYVKVSDGKNNMAPPVDAAEWFKLESYSLDNGTEDYPEGDSVQVAARWEPPAALDGMNDTEGAEALASIARGLPDGERYSARKQDKERWAGVVLIDQCMRSPAQATAILKTWLDTKVLEVREYHSSEQRKQRKGLFLTSEGNA